MYNFKFNKNMFTFKSPYGRLNFSYINQGDLHRLKVVLSTNTQTKEILDFDNAYEVSYDQNLKQYVVNTETIPNKKSNTVAVFNVKESDKYNPYKYAKLIVFISSIKDDINYGYLWIKEDGTTQNIKIELDYDEGAVARSIVRDMNVWTMHDIYDAYMHTPKLPETKIKEAYKKYIEIYRAYKFEDWQNSMRVFNARYVV